MTVATVSTVFTAQVQLHGPPRGQLVRDWVRDLRPGQPLLELRGPGDTPNIVCGWSCRAGYNPSRSFKITEKAQTTRALWVG